jgi:hypothetical protein
LPFGRGKPFVNQGWPAQIIGGFTLGSFFTYDDGLPVALTAQNNSNSFGGGSGTSMRPDVTGTPIAAPGGRQIKNGGVYFNPAAFSQPPSFQFGDAARYQSGIRSPGTLNWDMLAARHIPLGEPFSLDFRAEFFNAFNRVQFAGPNTSISSTSFGQIFLSQTNNPREIQAGLRLSF